ncbi:hypothetical protein Taro_025249 [Colocasia esculenta]|uniref:Oligopeptide transporter 7 n=1 Tax=Colocasia esculenta TaxID=4460 RepID=A0A843VDM7_COLES|nr:hypothetical protein [Colocasia esculenta]
MARRVESLEGGPPTDEGQEDNSLVQQVAMTVPTTDDHSLPVLTFRMWVLGTISCVLLSFVNQFFWYRKEPISVTAISAQIAVVPVGHLMARVITDRVFFRGTRWEFTLNPGPFNVKEHVLITIFANSGAGSVYAMHIVSAVKIFYQKQLTFFVALIVVLTTQVLGFGWAGIFRRYLVQPAEMWWPSNLVQVSLFGALHEKQKRPKGSLSRNQFFLIAFICSFAYYVFPGYLFTLLTSISWVCFIFPNSILAQQIGSGMEGMGTGAIGLDWSTISSYLGSPLASPWFATANIAAGFFLVMYIITPLSYWNNVYNAKTFPFFSKRLFTSSGQDYEISGIVDSHFHLDVAAYEKNGPLHLSTFFAMTYGVGFATLTATVTHVLLFHGRDIWSLTRTALNDQKMDIHTRLMSKYKQVPEWWFVTILLSNIALVLFACSYFNEQLQLPWWGVLLCCGIAFFFTLPIGIIAATTNQAPGLNIITEYIIGYIYPGRPVANVLFKTYGYISMVQALSFLSDFKLGHYMKIPPRTMFMAQVVGTVIAAVVYLSTGWWLMASVPNICLTNLLPSDSQWTCPMDQVFYDASVIWGLVGPRRMFGDLGIYAKVNWFFLVGAVAPVFVFIAHKLFPKQKWISLINMPILIGATGMMPPATSVNYTTWILAGFLSGFVAYRYRPQWWKRHNYLLSGALDAGLAFMGVLLFFCLGSIHVSIDWWGNREACPVASCPTAKGRKKGEVEKRKRMGRQLVESLEGGPRKEAGEEENSPVLQVAMTVPTTDDPSLPVLTFRMWVLGTISCVLLSFVNQFFWYRKEPISVTAISAQIAVVPVGHLMARVITDRVFFRGTRWEFTLNPGPFNVKEHVLITIFANSGAGTVYAMHIVTAVKIFYQKQLTYFVALIVVLTTQILGFGWAGIFRRYLVQPAEMWWPSDLVQVSLFGALHEKEKRPKGSLSRNQFFLIAFMCSFAYYVFPGYLFTLLTSISWVCFIFPNSILAQQIGSGMEGMGAGAIGLDWSTVSSYLGSPLASPWFATANIAVGFFIVMYIITPLSYWNNVYSAKTFPFFSSSLFTSSGQRYKISSIVDSHFHLDVTAYEKNGPLHLSTFFAMTYGVGFATLTATVTHVLLFHGRDIWKLTRTAFKDQRMDVHTRLMSKYKQVPEWWFVAILLSNIALVLFACSYFNEQLQLPWWGVLLCCGIAFFFTLPIGIITATTNQMPGLNIITEYIIGYIYPGRPVANVLFKTYGYISMVQALSFLSDFKLGHYMKIPPRTMFMAQVVGTLIAAVVYLSTGWWLMASVPNICLTNLLPSDSQWTCPMDKVFFDASVIWGLIGPRRIFGDLGNYPEVNWFFLAGAGAPVFVFIAHKLFPKQKWIRLINMPILIGATGMMPPATSVNYTTWILVGFLSGFVAYRYRPQWWKRHNYLLSGALDAGLAFMGVLLFFCLGSKGVSVDWWGNREACPVASCPTAKGVAADGCPLF